MALTNLKRLLVANRGEIACRIVTAAKHLGIATVAVYAAPDKTCRHVAAADEAVEVFNPTVKGAIAPYLHVEGIVEAAIKTNAQAPTSSHLLILKITAAVHAGDRAGLRLPLREL